MSWDVRGRLKTLVKGGTTHQFLYDFRHLRVKRTVGSTSTEYLLNGEEIVKEKTGAATTHLLQSPFTDQPLKRGSRWLIPDQLGSTALLTDDAGNTVQSYGYRPFGELTNTPTQNNPFQFTGRENDGTGLMYYRARYYAPEWGRFISEDPLGFGGGINQYAYCANNPVNATDPSGLKSFWQWVKDLATAAFEAAARMYGFEAPKPPTQWPPQTPPGVIVRDPGARPHLPPNVVIGPGPEPPTPPGPQPPAPPGPEPPQGPRPPRNPSGINGGGSRPTGSGGGLGGISTIATGTGVFADYLSVVVDYKQNNIDPGLDAIKAQELGLPDNGRW